MRKERGKQRRVGGTRLSLCNPTFRNSVEKERSVCQRKAAAASEVGERAGVCVCVVVDAKTGSCSQ